MYKYIIFIYTSYIYTEIIYIMHIYIYIYLYTYRKCLNIPDHSNSYLFLMIFVMCWQGSDVTSIFLYTVSWPSFLFLPWRVVAHSFFPKKESMDDLTQHFTLRSRSPPRNEAFVLARESWGIFSRTAECYGVFAQYGFRSLWRCISYKKWWFSIAMLVY